ITRQIPYLLANNNKTVQMQWLPLTRDNVLSKKESQEKAIVLEGQVFGIAAADLEKTTVDVMLGQEKFVAKVDKNGLFSTPVSGTQLAQAQVKTLQAQVHGPDGVVSAQLNYEVGEAAQVSKLDNHIDAMPLIQADAPMQTVSGKVVKQYSQSWLYFAIIMDNLAAGLAGAAFIAFLSSLTSVSFTAVQYAIFSSLMTLTPKIIGGYSGSIVNSIGYPNFFLFTTLLGLPILFLVWWVARLLKQQTQT
ncbi:MAG TPA: MFS transporter, partial [Vitreoscilla sp.]|nr:MFS transporter [Vitreoscilla sp.]